MNKFKSVGAAAALAVVVALGTIAPSFADPAGDAVGAGLAGGVLGFMAGAAIAGSQPHTDVYRGSRYEWRMHVRACADTYGEDYDPDSDTYIGYDGYPHRCRL